MEETKPWPLRTPKILGMMGKQPGKYKIASHCCDGEAQGLWNPAQRGPGGLPGGSWTERRIGQGQRNRVKEGRIKDTACAKTRRQERMVQECELMLMRST